MCFLFCCFFFFKPAFSCFFGDSSVAKVSLLLCSGDLTVKGLVPCFALFLLFNFLNTQLSFSVRWDQDGFKPIPPLYPDAAGNGQASSPLLTGSVCLPRLLVVFILFDSDKLLFTSVPTTSWEEPHKPNAATLAAIAITFSWGSFCFGCLDTSSQFRLIFHTGCHNTTRDGSFIIFRI